MIKLEFTCILNVIWKTVLQIGLKDTLFQRFESSLSRSRENGHDFVMGSKPTRVCFCYIITMM